MDRRDWRPVTANPVVVSGESTDHARLCGEDVLASRRLVLVRRKGVRVCRRRPHGTPGRVTSLERVGRASDDGLTARSRNGCWPATSTTASELRESYAVDVLQRLRITTVPAHRVRAVRGLSPPQLPQYPHELTEDRERPFTAEAARRLRREHRDGPSQDFRLLRRQVSHGSTVANTRSTRIRWKRERHPYPSARVLGPSKRSATRTFVGPRKGSNRAVSSTRDPARARRTVGLAFLTDGKRAPTASDASHSRS